MGNWVYSPTTGCVDINTLIGPTWRIALVGDVNEQGQIAATGRRGNLAATHALRLDPISPAASIATLGKGCGASAIPPILAGWKGAIPIPARRSLLAAKFALQAFLVPTRGSLGVDLSHALNGTAGF